MNRSLLEQSREDERLELDATNACYKTISLNRERYAAQYKIPLAHVDAMAMVDRASNGLFIRLYHDVYCAKKTKSISITVPDTWLNAFKLRWYPKWAIKRYPVKYRIITESVDAIALFPELQSSRGEHRIEFIIADGIGI